jgi:hypothetical protein
MSSGYDSNAVAVIAREAGTSEAFTVTRARRDASNLFSLDDSGASVAAQLGLRCTGVDSVRQEYAFEDAAWASTGNAGDLHLTVFDYPKPVCLLFTGFRGDGIWGTNDEMVRHRRAGEPGGTRFSELRLELGVITCTPVLWGSPHQSQIRRLSSQPEMHPWTLNNDYDRPIPRRLLEEAGVKRGTFAVRKRVSSFNRRYGRPFSPSLRQDFARFLEDRHLRPGSPWAERLLLLRNGLHWMLLRRLPKRVRIPPPASTSLPEPTLFFLWAAQRCAQRYERGLAASAYALSRPTAAAAAL